MADQKRGEIKTAGPTRGYGSESEKGIMRGNCQRSADAKSGPCIKSASTRIDANWQHEVVLGRMSKAKRIQRSRAKGWKMPANAIYVGRPTVWGNPYVVGSQLLNGETLTAEKAIALYEQHVADNFNERDIRHCLHDKDLACWCALDQPCHADVLLRIANSRPK